MNRREALGSLVLGIGAITVGVQAAGDVGDGLPDELHAETYRRHLAENEELEVRLDGVSVRWSCVAANRKDGWVDLIVFDTEGRVIVRDEDVVIERCYGRVEFRRVVVESLNHAEPQGGQPWRG